MKLSKQAINEFKMIYKAKYSKQLTDEDADRLGVEFLMFFELIYKPIPKDIES